MGIFKKMFHPFVIVWQVVINPAMLVMWVLILVTLVHIIANCVIWIQN